MSNNDKETKIICGTILGGIVALGAYSIYCACSKKSKSSSLNVISSTLSNMANKLDSCKDEAQSAVSGVEKEVKKHENLIGEILELVTIGINLWKGLKRG